MRYVNFKLRQYQKEFAYRVFVTESLRLQGEGKYLIVKYAELFEEKKEIDGNKIALDVIKNAGLKLGD